MIKITENRKQGRTNDTREVITGHNRFTPVLSFIVCYHGHDSTKNSLIPSLVFSSVQTNDRILALSTLSLSLSLCLSFLLTLLSTSKHGVRAKQTTRRGKQWTRRMFLGQAPLKRVISVQKNNEPNRPISRSSDQSVYGESLSKIDAFFSFSQQETYD